MKKFFLVVLLASSIGCQSTDLAADFHTAGSIALGVVTAAIDNPETVDECKSLVKAFIAKAAPEDLPEAQAVLDKLNAGDLAGAQAGLAILVARTGPASAAVKARMARSKKAQ